MRNANSHDRLSSTTPKPPSPQSSPPTLSELKQRVAIRRRARTGRRFLGSFAMFLSILAIWGVANRSLRPTTVPRSPFAGVNSLEDNSPRAMSIGKANSTIVVSPTPSSIAETTAVSAPTEQSFRVLAHVRQSLPVFQRGEEDDLFLHIGWMSSEEFVPVDLGQFPPQQQNRIQEVLTGNTTAEFISL